MTDSASLRLWQLISPALPVGAYAYSAGLEHAITDGWVTGEQGLTAWTAGQLAGPLAALDVPLLARLAVAWESGDDGALDGWSRWLTACRETTELRREDAHLGRALMRLLGDLDVAEAADWPRERPVTWATAFALAATHWGIPVRTAASGYLWAWLENQVAAGVKLVPLGQSAGQRVLLAAGGEIDAAVKRGLALEDDAMGESAPGVAIASSRHETQYSRLFRS